MKIRVQTVNETPDTIELPDTGWRVLSIGELNCLVGAGLTHAFTPDGFYQGTTKTVAIVDKDFYISSDEPWAHAASRLAVRRPQS